MTTVQRGRAGAGKKTEAEASEFYAECRKKRAILRKEYGGMMSLTDLALELGYRDYHSARAWADAEGLPTTMIGSRRKYDTDLVARKLVTLRGMAPEW